VSALVAGWLRDLSWREIVASAVDVLVVYYLIYRALLLVRGTRAAQMLAGLALVAVAFFVARVFELATLLWLVDNFINYSIIFLIVIFQHDIRRALSRVGKNLAVWGRPHETVQLVEEVAQAAERLARSRLGALIVFERDAALDDFYGDPGQPVDARVSSELLVAIFVPSPINVLHDGAVVIRNLRLHRAGAVLPLSASARLEKSLGTRHRAAVGVTEETDAVAVVVSEERGAIAICHAGEIRHGLDGQALRHGLRELLGSERRPPERRPAEPTPPPPTVAGEPTSRTGGDTGGSSARDATGA
jgi:uncharacterized protein (TIGR00159 family)